MEVGGDRLGYCLYFWVLINFLINSGVGDMLGCGLGCFWGYFSVGWLLNFIGLGILFDWVLFFLFCILNSYVVVFEFLRFIVWG